MGIGRLIPPVYVVVTPACRRSRRPCPLYHAFVLFILLLVVLYSVYCQPCRRSRSAFFVAHIVPQCIAPSLSNCLQEIKEAAERLALENKRLEKQLQLERSLKER
jgi:hypothetical protein